MREENQLLRRQIEESAAERQLNAQTIASSSPSQQMPEAEFRELLRLRGEVANLRRQQEAAAKDLPTTKVARVPAENAGVDTGWVQQVLNSPPREQGAAAGALRGKLLSGDATKTSPSELALREELLKRQLNQSLERSPAEFADFQAAFIQSTVGISDPAKTQQIHDLIQKTYENAVANGLDIPSKPAEGAEEWVQRRFQLDRAATKQLQALMTPEERRLFDRAFLGLMGVDLGGVGVDRSNYPKGFLGE
jgi:hypothetical protein